MSIQWMDMVNHERLARTYRALADMIAHGCEEQSVRDLAWEAGVNQDEVDRLFVTVLGGDEEPADQYNREDYMEASA